MAEQKPNEHRSNVVHLEAWKPRWGAQQCSSTQEHTETAVKQKKPRTHFLLLCHKTCSEENACIGLEPPIN